MKRLVLTAFAVLLCFFALSSASYAQDAAAPDPAPSVSGLVDLNQYDFTKPCGPDGGSLQTGLDAILTKLTAPSVGIAGRSYGVATGIFFFVGGFAFVWFLLKTVRQTRHPMELLSTFAFKMLMFAVFFLMMNFAAGNDGGQPGVVRVETWAGKIAATIGGQPNAPQTTGEIAATGVCVSYKIFAIPLAAIWKKANAEADGQAPWDVIRIWTANLSALILVVLLDLVAFIVTLLAYIVLAFQTFIIDYTAQVLAVAAIFLLGFSASPWTLPLSEPYWRLVWSTAIFKFTLIFSAAALSVFATYCESSVMAGLATPTEGGVQPLLPIIWTMFAMTFALALVLNVPKIAQSFLSGSVALGGKDMIGAGLGAGLAAAGTLKGLTAATSMLASAVSKAMGSRQGAGGGIGEGAGSSTLARNTVASGLTQNLGSSSKQSAGQREVSSTSGSERSTSSGRSQQTSQRQSPTPSAQPSPASRPTASQRREGKPADTEATNTKEPTHSPDQVQGERGAEVADNTAAVAASADGAHVHDSASEHDQERAAQPDNARDLAPTTPEATQLARSEAMLASIAENLEAAAESGDLHAIASSANVLAATGKPVSSALSSGPAKDRPATKGRAAQITALSKAASSIARAASAAEKVDAPKPTREAIATAAGQVARAASAGGSASGARLGSATSALSSAAKATASTKGIPPQVTASLADATSAVGAEVSRAPVAFDQPSTAQQAPTTPAPGRAASAGAWSTSAPDSSPSTPQPQPVSQEAMFERLTRQFSTDIGEHMREHADRNESAIADLSATLKEGAAAAPRAGEKPDPEKPSKEKPRGDAWRDRRKQFQRHLADSMDSPISGPGLAVTHLSHKPH